IDNTFTLGDRSVRLLKGEAYFSVSPDPRHPFRVIAGDTTITVLGTAFDVRLDAQGTTVAVEHGKVRVEDEDAASTIFLLGSGDWLLLSDRKAPVVGHDANPEAAAWRNGQLWGGARPP